MLEIANHALHVEAERMAEKSRFRLAEVEHRLMNTFGVIQALVTSSACPGDTVSIFRAKFGSRLVALARSHALLSSNHPADATLEEVVGCCLEPYDDGSDRIALDGPVVFLPARDVPKLGLAIHELATNASKHGALSRSDGRIEVTWQLETSETAAGSAVTILWREQNGPPVRTPERRGFGSRLLERGLADRPGSAVRLVFAPNGLECRIRLPLAPV